jgi:hypothetical protein
MFIGPLVLLVVVPALMTLFLDRRDGAGPVAPVDTPIRPQPGT